MYMSKML